MKDNKTQERASWTTPKLVELEQDLSSVNFGKLPMTDGDTGYNTSMS